MAYSLILSTAPSSTPFLREIDGDHILPDGRVLHPECAGLVHEPGTEEEVLDLLGAQAVALVLYHGVLAPEEVQVPFLVALTVSPE